MFNIANMPNQIDIGFTGEKNFRKIEINMAKWMEEMPDGVPSIVHIRPGETASDAYIASTTFADNILTWTISAGDLGSTEGVGTAQIWLEAEENNSIIKRGKSILVATMIHGAINDASESVPAAQTAWMEQMTALKVATENAASAAELATVHEPTVDGETGNWLVWNQESGQYVDTGITSRGQLGAKSIVFVLDDVENESGAYEHTTVIEAATNTMKPIAIEVGSPNIFGGDITVTCNNGSITVSCPSVSGESTLKIICEEMAQSPYEPFVTSEEFAVLDGRIGTLANLETTEKGSIVGAINEIVEGGTGGVTDYDDLTDKPSINSVTLSGNKSLSDLGIASASDLSAKYSKPSGGIPSTDLASGVLTSIIDDTAGSGDTDKTFSADKLTSDFSDVLNAITQKYTKPNTGIPASDLASGVIPDVSGKQNAPATAGTAGQVLGLDNNLAPVWKTVSGGGTVDDELSPTSTNPVENKAITNAIDSKASGIVKSIALAKDTVFDSDNGTIKNPVVYGNTEQQKDFAYNIIDTSKISSIQNQSSAVASITFDGSTVEATVTASTNKVKFLYKGCWNFTAEEVSAIVNAGAVVTFRYTIESNVASNYEFRPHFDFILNGTTKYQSSKGFAKGTNQTKEVSFADALQYDFDTLQIWWEISRTGGNNFSVDDYFRLTKFEGTIDTTAHKYKIVNASNFTISVGETDAEVPYTLRGVPDDDGNIVVNGITYLSDYLDPSTGKITRWIDSDIDSCVDDVVDYSDYILEESTEEDASSSVCNNIKALKTEYPETDVDADGGFIAFDYLVDTKTYIDRSSGQGFVTPEQYGAAGDGETDDTEALQAMFSSGAEVIKLSDNKTYMVSGQVNINGADSISIFGNGSTIKRIGGNLSEVNNDEYVLSTDSSSTGRKSITIQNLHICANATGYTDDVNSYGYNILPGLCVYGYDTVRLDGVEISDTLTGRGYLITQAVHGMLENCYVHDIGQPDNVKVIFPNYSCGGGTFIIKDGSYAGSTFSVKNSRFERITASCHGSRSQYMEVMGNTYIECQDVIVEQTDTNPVDAVSVNKHRVIKGNHLIRCANSIFSCSSAMSADNDTTGKTVVIEGNVIEDAGNINYYDLTSSPRTYSRKARRMLGLINDNNNIKAPYQKVIIKNNYVYYAANLDGTNSVCNIFGDIIEFTGNTIIAEDIEDGFATVNAINNDAVIIVNGNTFESAGVTHAGFWEKVIDENNVFMGGGITRDSELVTNSASKIVEVRNNRQLNDSGSLFHIKLSSNNIKHRIIGNIAKNLITCDYATCTGKGIVKDNVTDNEFLDTTNSGSYTVTGTTAYTMS